MWCLTVPLYCVTITHEKIILFNPAPILFYMEVITLENNTSTPITFSDIKVVPKEGFKPLPYDGTFESARQCHYHLWNYLAETGVPDKPFIPEILLSCYACEYTKYNCARCPLFGPISKGGCSKLCNNFLYYQWLQCGNTEERKKLAAMIRDLPWRIF